MLTAEQLEARRLGVGGSEVAALFGLHPFIGELDVWLSKVERFDRPANEDMQRGTFLESGVANWYASRADESGAVTREIDPWIHPLFPECRCSPDRLVLLGSKRERLLSIKCPRRAGDEWGETGGHVIPTYATLQLQYEHAIGTALGVPLDPVSHLAALVDGELRVYPVPADVELQGWLIAEVRRWWADRVVGHNQPPLDGGDGASAWLRKRFPRNTQPARPATLEEDAALLELRAAEAAKDAAEAAYRTKRQVIEQAIGEAGGLEGSVGVVSWRANKNGVRSFKPKWAEEKQA